MYAQVGTEMYKSFDLKFASNHSTTFLHLTQSNYDWVRFKENKYKEIND